MTNQKTFFLFILLLAVSGYSQAQNETWRFGKIVYHSTQCFGTCPTIDLQVDSNRNVLLHLQMFKSKSEFEEKGSGQFKGRLEKAQYDELVKRLQTSNYQNFIFPNELCCDGPVTTLIIYNNGKRTYLKSMFPPTEANELIRFLYDLALGLNIPKTSEELVFEN